ncbi:MAG: hypothetical protein JRG91_12810 [Deltaproteobacteria bacterium]|nr:hypothetical protein [Deltaproteobacteria bacterium]
MARLAMGVLVRASSMGLLEGFTVRSLDRDVVLEALGRISRAGVGVGALASAGERGMRLVLERVVEALESSAVPEREWPGLVEMFGVDGLGELVGVSGSSIRRYAAGARRTPQDVAMRVHFLALVVGDLSGTYNEYGIRRWFSRARSALGGKAPGNILGGEWDPDARGPSRVRELARSLADMVGT